jgi:hypothetical protein
LQARRIKFAIRSAGRNFFIKGCYMEKVEKGQEKTPGEAKNKKREQEKLLLPL